MLCMWDTNSSKNLTNCNITLSISNPHVEQLFSFIASKILIRNDVHFLYQLDFLQFNLMLTLGDDVPFETKLGSFVLAMAINLFLCFVTSYVIFLSFVNLKIHLNLRDFINY